MDCNMNTSSLDIVFKYARNNQISRISQELLDESINELDDKWSKWSDICGKQKNISINKQIIVEFLDKLVELKHNTGREIAKDFNDLHIRATTEYDYLKTYSDLAGHIKSPKPQMEQRNPKTVPEEVSEEEKKLSTQSDYRPNSISKQQGANDSNLSRLNNIPNPSLTEEQGPDNKASTSTLKDDQGSLLMVLKEKQTVSSELQARSGAIGAELNTSKETGTPDANQTNYVVQITSLSHNSGPNEVSEIYLSVYTNEWKNIFDSIKRKIGEGRSVEFLKEILKSLYHSCLENAENQIRMMMKEAIDVVRGETSPTGEPMTQEDIELLKEYRRMNAVLSLPYLKKKFFSTQLPVLKQKCKIQTDQAPSKALQTFVSKCVEVTWFASIRDPPMVLDFDFQAKSEEDLNQAVDAFKTCQNGRRVQYIVWPPLRLGKNGPIVRKGVAALM